MTTHLKIMKMMIFLLILLNARHVSNLYVDITYINISQILYYNCGPIKETLNSITPIHSIFPLLNGMKM